MMGSGARFLSTAPTFPSVEAAMSGCRVALSLGTLLLATSLQAEPENPPSIRVIPKSYISPGASGSIGTSQQSERHDLYGGARPPGAGFGQEHNYPGSPSVARPGGFRGRALSPTSAAVRPPRRTPSAVPEMPAGPGGRTSGSAHSRAARPSG